MRALCHLIVFIVSLGTQSPQKTSPAADTLPSDPEIEKILIDRIDVLHKSTGMIVGQASAFSR